MRYIPNVCTTDAPFRFTCPHVTGFMSSSVLWGTIGPRKIFGSGAPYSMLLMGFPFGMVLTLAFWFVRRRPAMLARAGWLRQVHPVVILSGAIHWAPYNIGYIWPAVPIAWLSWVYIKPRYLEFWSKVSAVGPRPCLGGWLLGGMRMGWHG